MRLNTSCLFENDLREQVLQPVCVTTCSGHKWIMKSIWNWGVWKCADKGSPSGGTFSDCLLCVFLFFIFRVHWWTMRVWFLYSTTQSAQLRRSLKNCRLLQRLRSRSMLPERSIDPVGSHWSFKVLCQVSYWALSPKFYICNSEQAVACRVCVGMFVGIVCHVIIVSFVGELCFS